MRRFPPPWSVETLDAGFKIVDANGQSLAYVYGHADVRDAQVANALTLDEARRIATSRYTIQPNSRALSFATRHARLRKSDRGIGVCKSSRCGMFFARSWGEFARLKYVTL